MPGASREEGVSLEIVGADARQIYREISVGTAKPGLGERGGVPHHMLDVAEPGETYSAARYADEAALCIEDMYRRGAYPLVVGGSGLYIRALVDGFFDGPEAQPGIRSRLEAEASKRGHAAMYERLAAVDPDTASKLHPNDHKRVVRALEVYEATGRPVSRLRAEQKAPRFPSPLYIGLRYPASVLAGRIERRVRRMLSGGMLEEVAMLAERNLTDARIFEGLGFREALALRNGRMAGDEAVREISRLHRSYAKRQRTWFQKLKGVNWLEPQERDFGVLLEEPTISSPGTWSRSLAWRVLLERRADRFQGCGKSTIGPLLAREMGFSFHDLDHLIEQRHFDETGERPGFRQIFRTRGEESFRAMERHLLYEQLGRDDLVLALGGGTPMARGVESVLATHCVVYLGWARMRSSSGCARTAGRPISKTRRTPKGRFVCFSKARSAL